MVINTFVGRGLGVSVKAAVFPSKNTVEYTSWQRPKELEARRRRES